MAAARSSLAPGLNVNLEEPRLTPNILSFFQPVPFVTAPATNAEAEQVNIDSARPAGLSLPADANGATGTPLVAAAPMKQFTFTGAGTHRADAFSPETGKALAATPKTGSELIEELRNKNKKLEAENIKLKTENASLKRKLSTANVQGAGPVAAGPPTKKQKPLDGNKLFAKWGKALVRAVPKEKFDSSCWGGEYRKVVVPEQGMLQEVFLALFDGKGELIQPTKNNKPTSVVTIRRFGTFEAIQELFGAQNIQHEGYTASLWRKRSFQKSYKSSESEATLESLEVQYNRNKLSLELHFGIELKDDDAW